ncbi:hypothetical protein [Stutzerimonas marianensis]
MDNKLNGTQIWADGYSFMEVSETFITALGLHKGEAATPKPEAELNDVAAEPNFVAHGEPAGSW